MNLNSTILGQSISFFLFVWVCMKYIWPPILI
ncbi:F0F1 ATP synthase subunit B, partial [Buchnera aphidicola (Pemphigus obesinymphae)]|nr:F0F1 ATP synthase subunit B [Buchnera aphidicola (Pemphigus obesinymphae)]